jgi:hypothetical protein
MEAHPCPVCSEDVALVTLGRYSDGRIVPTAGGLLIERKSCPACGASLERTPVEHWRKAVSLVPRSARRRRWGLAGRFAVRS